MAEKLTSEQLTALALRARSDEDALNELIAYEIGYVTRWVRSKAQKNYPNDVDDIVQEILIRISDSISAFQGRSAYSTWSGRVISGGFIAWLRWRGRQKEDGVNGNICTVRQMEELCGSYEMVDMLESREAFANLIGLALEGNRYSLELRFRMDYLVEDIADTCEVSWDCARDRVKRGLVQIKAGLHRKKFLTPPSFL